MNDRLLELRAELDRSRDPEAVRAEASRLIGMRARALARVSSESTPDALRLALPDDVAADLAAAFPAAAAGLERAVELSGLVETVVIDAPAAHASTVLRRLRTSDGSLLALDLPADAPEPRSGSEVSVSGVRVGDRVAAAAVRPSPLARTASASSCATTGQQDVAVLLVRLAGSPVPTLGPADVFDVFFGSSGSVDAYVREASYGKAWLAGDVFGWYTVSSADACVKYEDVRTAAIAAADRDVDFRRYSRVFVVISGAPACTWAGIGSISCATLSSQRDGSFTASSSWMLAPYLSDRAPAVALAAHELGHNLGLAHAGSRRFGPEPLGAIGAAGTVDEYGDPFSAMGASSPGHYGAKHKLALGWMAPNANVVTVETSGSFVLAPVETASGGAQALRVRRGTGNDAWLWIAYRQPIGADAALPGKPFGGALVHYEDATTGLQTQLLDFTPATATFADPTLASGAAWSDPYSNLSISVGHATGNGLEVTVAYGAPKCVSAAPAVTFSPASRSVAAGGQATYQVTVQSNDSAACASSTFGLSASAPAPLGASLSPSSLTLAPGASGSAVLTVSSPDGTAPGSFDLAVTASSAGSSGSAHASCTVVSTSLSSVLVVPDVPYARGDTVALSVTATTSGQPASGAAVTFTITKPNGVRVSSTQTANADGKAAWSYRIAKNDPRGTYAVAASVSYSGRTTTPAAGSFTVQ